MPKDFSRMDRIGELIQRELALYIQRELRDEGLNFISLSRVMVSKDMSHAKIYITQLDEKISAKKNVDALNALSKELRQHIAKTLNLRVTPELRFYFDESLSYANQLTSLIDEAIKKDHSKKG